MGSNLRMQKVKPLEAFQLCLRYLIARVLCLRPQGEEGFPC